VLWLPRFLFLVTVLASLVLTAAVFVAPILAASPDGGLWADLHALFASDIAVRRTAIASAIGLLVTAWIFFRPRAGSAGYADQTRRKHRPPPSNIAGA
jgi:hypothetical protein